MKIVISTIFVCYFLVNMCFSQRWNYKVEINEFDGKSRTAYIEGSGGHVFSHPYFMMGYVENTNELIFAISDVGYSGCDNNSIKIKFDNDDNIYIFDVVSSVDYEIWYLKENSITIPNFIEKLILNNKMSIRVSSDCQVEDFSFSLKGSSKAIKFVLPNDYFMKQKQKERKDRYNEQILQADELFKLGKLDKALALYNDIIKHYPNEEYPQSKVQEIKDITRKRELIFHQHLAKAKAYTRENKYALALDEYWIANHNFPDKFDIKNKVDSILKNGMFSFVVTSTNLYPNDDGSGKPLIKVDIHTYVQILNKDTLNQEFLYASYKGFKGYISIFAFD